MQEESSMTSNKNNQAILEISSPRETQMVGGNHQLIGKQNDDSNADSEGVVEFILHCFFFFLFCFGYNR